MNSINRAFAALLLSTVYACGGDGSGAIVEVETEEEGRQYPTWEEYREQAKVTGAGYLVEWDLSFATESALYEHYLANVASDKQKLAIFQRLSDGFEPVFTGNDALDISYCVSNVFAAAKATAILDMASATRSWEDVANVRFRYDSAHDATCNQNNANVDFALMPTTIPDLFGCAASKMSWLGCEVNGVDVTGVLLLNYGKFPGAPPFNGATPVGVLRHELGHMIGFRHEHPWAPQGCSEAPTMANFNLTGRRLTAYDQLSVMHYPVPQCNGIAGSDPAISTLDGEGARLVYGMPASWYLSFI